MGFFSKLKKFWQADTAPDDTAKAVTPDQEAGQPAPAEAADAAAPQPRTESAPPAPADAPPAAPAPGTIAGPQSETVAEEPAPGPRPEVVRETLAHDVEPTLPQTPTAGQPADLPPAPAAPRPGPAAAEEPAAPGDQPEAAGMAAITPAPQPGPTTGAQPEPQPASKAAGQPVPPPAAPVPPVASATPAAAAQPAAPSGPEAGSEQAVWRNSLILALRQAEPKLSVWLDILLADVTTAGPVLWERLHFLFDSLEAPAGEADAFVAKFAAWVTLMEYDEVELFRSELQYRLALALDLEDEEDERNRLFLKLSEGLAKTKEQIVKRLDGMLGRHSVIDEAFWEELEEILLMADVGFEPAAKLLGNLREKVRKRGTTDPAVFKEILREELSEIFRPNKTIRAINPPEVVMMIGVNGVGKTTTIAKLAHRDRMQGKKVMIAAADTFRAAAIEQLQVWAGRVDALFHARTAGSDPAAVAYEAMDRALQEGVDVLYVDTAGRLQTKVNLMEELSKIRQVLGKKHAGAPHRTILVIDATTGQNALSQTKLFKEAAGIDELIITKLDGTAKGGVAIAVAMQHHLPITYVGLGEKMEDLRPFSGEDYARALLGVKTEA
jgi:fused signal recognition particle receptor